MEAQAHRTQPVLCYHCVFFSLYHLVTRSPPPPALIHPLPSHFLPCCCFIFSPPTCLRPPTRGEAAKQGDTTMTRANVWPFCVTVTEAIVSPKQWMDANSECSDCDRVLLTMKTLFEPSKEKFFRSFAGCYLHDQAAVA